MKRILWKYILIPTILFIVSFFIFDSFYTFYRVNGSSMEPSLKEGEVYLVNKWESSIDRGDIIVFQSEIDKLSYIKRVIALPGESLEIFDNHVYIDGQMLSEPYLSDHANIKDVEAITVPPDHVYVLGDERVASHDSRHIGPIPQKDIIGTISLER